MLKNLRPFAAVAGLSLLVAAGCGSSRTTAATQSTVAAFDPAKSDPKAVAIADKMIAKLGGYPAWDATRQIQFDLKYYNGGQLQSWFKHAWDKWNGRHRFEHVDMNTLREAEREGDPGRVRSLVVMYDLFNRDRGFARYGNDELPSAEKKKRVEEAFKRWQDDAYKLAFLFKLKDPGVILGYDTLVTPIEDRLCKPNCDILTVKFADGVGTDTYYVGVNTETSMPELMQKQVGDQGRLGFEYKGWVEAGGLKFPAKLENLGVAGEIFEFSNVKIGEPDDSLYIPAVR
jgi:hypothetical protein